MHVFKVPDESEMFSQVVRACLTVNPQQRPDCAGVLRMLEQSEKGLSLSMSDSCVKCAGSNKSCARLLNISCTEPPVVERTFQSIRYTLL